MRKFCKTIIVISAILAVVGIGLIIIGANMGGKEIIENNLAYDKLPLIHFDIDDIDTEGMENFAQEDSKFDEEEIKNIELKGKYGEFQFNQWKQDYIAVKVEKGAENVKYSLQNNTLTIVDNSNRKFWRNNICKVKVYLPTNYKMEKLDISIGAGELEANYISAGELSINIGAGEGNFENVMVDSMKVSVAAGQVEIIGGEVGACDVNVGMGELDFSGKMLGNADITCGAGQISLELEDNYKDFNYALKVGAGEIEINDNEYSGFSNRHILDNSAQKEMNIDCGMGEVSVELFH